MNYRASNSQKRREIGNFLCTRFFSSQCIRRWCKQIGAKKSGAVQVAILVWSSWSLIEFKSIYQNCTCVLSDCLKQSLLFTENQIYETWTSKMLLIHSTKKYFWLSHTLQIGGEILLRAVFFFFTGIKVLEVHIYLYQHPTFLTFLFHKL